MRNYNWFWLNFAKVIPVRRRAVVRSKRGFILEVLRGWWWGCGLMGLEGFFIVGKWYFMSG
jgi:hypothetical protein